MSGARMHRLNRLNRLTPLRGSNGAAFGPDGRLYVAQFLAGQISAVDVRTGDVEVVVPPGGPVQSPDDLAFAPDGTMYIIDTVPGRVWRRTADGTITLVTDQVRLPNGIAFAGERLFVNEMTRDGRLLELRAGDEPAVLTGGLAVGNAMQLGPDGHLYYPHMLTGEVHRVSPDGGAPELVAAGVHQPVAVRFDLAGTLLVLSRGAEGIVTRIDLHGSGDRTIVTSGITGLDNAAFDAENRMFVTSFASGGLSELHPDGRTREIAPRGLTGPYGITVDLGGTVHAADHYRLARAQGPDADVATTALLHFVHGVAADGDLLHLTSQYGQVNTYHQTTGTVRMRATGLDAPLGIVAGPDGTLIVAESGAGRVLTIDADDTVTVLADGLGRPAGVAVHDGHVYVSDERHGTVSRLDDGVPVPLIEDLDTPQGLAISDGRLFAAEAGRHRLVSVDLLTGGHPQTTDVPSAGGAHRDLPALSAHGLPGVPRPFAGLAAAPDGSLYLAADGEGGILHLTPAEHP
ncbi:sugar lactone lactonase YvrE [Catenuloplanes nepalensis]|uniref:Sugar lactone lactonase YvrE n=1 Tax=Catenuloplanes nepalensis TaxID=587533 RepID=A0ABT9MSA7_9ACTN|nr:hypothetical protein [Catenuloplanes nepalensis]MDP9794161.1 sugar lactone lactonase YvrE [Catenuloplanes nepalensis]